MKLTNTYKLKTRAVAAAGAIILLAVGLNTALTVSSVSGKYRDALIGRITAYADTMRRDADKFSGMGLSLTMMEGMSERLRALAESDADIARAMVMDAEGKVLFCSEKRNEGAVLSDEPSKQALAASAPVVITYTDKSGELYEKVIPLLGSDGKKMGVFRVALYAAAVKRQLRSVLWLSLAVGVFCVLAGTALAAWFMQRSILGPLDDMAKTASQMAAGDLTCEVAVRGRSEIADLGAAINTMSSNLRDTLSRAAQTSDSLNEAMMLLQESTRKMSRGAKVQHEAGEQTASTVNEMLASIRGVAENAGEMSKAAADASSSVTQMVASIEEVASNAGGLSGAAEETAASIVQTLASIRQVSENTEELSASAEQTSSSITEMSSTVKEVEQKAVESAQLAERVAKDASESGLVAAREAMKGMERIRTAVEATADVINRLGKRSQEIGQILQVIDEVTDQTSLLALNAAILAAQAGEHGKGFAVVAEEIRELAERTAASTKEISNLIATVQEETSASVQAMGKGLKAVEEGVGLVRVTSDVFERVSVSSRKSAEMARTIELTTAEQARGVAQITQAAVKIAEQIEQISHSMQEQQRGSERIAQAAERMRDITRQLKVSTEEQTVGSRQIARAVESVTAQAAQVASSTSEQSRGAQQISDAINSIQKITEENVDVSVEMDMAEMAIQEKAAALRRALDNFKL